MTAHDQNEASNRISITSLTMLSDCRNSSKTERVGVTVPGSAVVSRGCIYGDLLWRLLDERWRDRRLTLCDERSAQAGRDPARPTVMPDTGEEQFERDQHRPVAADFLVEQQRRAGDLDDPCIDAQRVVEPRRAAVIGGEAPHREDDAGLGTDAAVGKAEAAHHLGAPTLGEFEVVGV